MLINVGGAVLNIEKIYSALIGTEFEEKSIPVDDGFLGLFRTYKKEKVFSHFVLKVKYKCIDGKEYTFTSGNVDKKILEGYLKSIITQMKGFDNEIVTAAFEAAMFGDSNGSNSN